MSGRLQTSFLVVMNNHCKKKITFIVNQSIQLISPNNISLKWYLSFHTIYMRTGYTIQYVVFIMRTNFKGIEEHCWCSGIMQDSHSCDSGSIPGQCKVFYLLMDFFLFKITKSEMFENEWRGHPGLNWGPLDLQSNALPLSYTPLGSPLPAYLNQIHLSFPHFHIRNFII